jgi:SP family sugar porter-like MFS transporter
VIIFVFDTFTGLVPSIILIVGLSFIPESPRWLAKVGRQKEFEIALQRLRGKDADVSIEAAEIKEFIETIENLPKAGVQDLFNRAYIRPVIVGVGLMVFQQFVGINGILFYASETFVSAGFASGDLGTILMGCIQAPITAVGALLMDRSGRRPLLLVSALKFSALGELLQQKLLKNTLNHFLLFLSRFQHQDS